MSRSAFEPASAAAAEVPQAVALQMEAARRLGLEARILDPEFGYLFEVRDGERRVLLLGGRSPLNDAVASRLAEDKFYTGLLLARRGHRVPRSARCLAPGHFQAEDYEARSGPGPGLALAAEIGYPAIVKPNRGACGRDVVEAANEAELTRALARVWRREGVALVQERIPGPDLRLDFLDGRYLLGYERFPVRVTGDGRRTLRELVEAIDPRYARDRFWSASTRHPLWRDRVEARGWGAGTVPAIGERIDLGETILNLNVWASARLVREVPPAWEELSLDVGRTLGLRHFGIDFKGARLDEDPAKAWILEVNASPLLVQAWRMGHEEEALAAQIRVLRACLDTPAR